MERILLTAPLQPVNGFLILAAEEMAVSARFRESMDHRVVRAQSESAFGVPLCRIIVTGKVPDCGAFAEGKSGIGIERNRAIKPGDRGRQIGVEVAQSERRLRKHDRVTRLETNSLVCELYAFGGFRLFILHPAIHAATLDPAGEIGVGKTKAWIEFQSFPRHCYCPVYILALEQLLFSQRTKEPVISLQILRRLVAGPSNFRFHERGLDRGYDRGRDMILEIEHFLERAVEAIRP